MFVGTSHDTPAFAVDAIAQWWQQEGRHRYSATRELFILADGGGSNGSRCRAWKKALQDTIRTPLGLTVTVSHYPPGASKWNPIEHRLLSQISKNWPGEPLTGIDKILQFIRTTKTESGLIVNTDLMRRHSRFSRSGYGDTKWSAWFFAGGSTRSTSAAL